MDISHSDGDNLSDDEIFTGKLTLKEIKKQIMLNYHEQNKNCNIINPEKDFNTSLQIIKTNSAPNLRRLKDNHTSKFSSVPGSPKVDNRKSDDSFIEMENIVEKLCLSPEQAENLELNNTLEVIDYILNNGPNKNNKCDTKNEFENKNCETDIKYVSPFKSTEDQSPKYLTPAKINIKQETDIFKTPSSVPLKPIFKTPANPTCTKALKSSKKTPSKTNAYQHITSPIASYIKNSPQVPLVKNIYPRKPLPGPSSIPKLVKPPQQNVQNKENINLPSVAYKSAKNTRVICLPDKEKLPQSQWAQKLTSTLPRPTVMRHEKREFIDKKVLVNQQDSFDISCLQADVSVCTQKTVFKTK